MPNLNDYNLDNLGPKKLKDIHLPQDVEKEAARMANDPAQTPDRAAELAYLTRVEIFDILKHEAGKGGNDNKKENYKEAFDALLQGNRVFQRKIAYYKLLLQKAQETLKSGLKRHAKESTELNGDYLKYKGLWSEQLDIEKQLDAVMAELFAERGRDPDSTLVETRRLLEDELKRARHDIAELKRKNSDTAAFLEYEKIQEYAQELSHGFAWTPSRRHIVNEALKRAMASRPLIVFMGESGTGKTALARALSQKLTGMEPEREVGGKDYRLRDLLGARAIDEHGDYMKFGPLLRAMTGMDSSRDASPKTQGGIYFDDEFNTRPVEVQRQILKFVAEAKPGQKVTVPGTELKVTVQSKFLYLAAGNPNNARYDREETPVEAYREFSGVLNVDYLENNKLSPELMEVMVASLMDQKTGRLRVVSKEEIMPSFIKGANEQEYLDELPATGGFLWRFSQAWKGVLQAFAHQENPLQILHPDQNPEKYHLQKFVLDLGKVRDWLHQYKISSGDQREGLEHYLKLKLREELQSAPSEDQVIVKDMMNIFAIDLDHIESSSKRFTVMTPKEIGYLFPNVPRPAVKSQNKQSPDTPEPPPVTIGDDGEDQSVTHSAPSLSQTHAYTHATFYSALGNIRSLSDSDKRKLIDMVRLTYTDSIATAKELDPNVQIKSIEEVFGHLLALGPAKLKEIAQFQKPTLLVTPQNSFSEKEKGMNSKKMYAGQNDMYVWQDTKSPYTMVKNHHKTVISAVDGAEHMPHINSIASDSKWKDRREAFKRHYAQTGLRLINPHEYAVLMQRSLDAFKKAGGKDTSKIVDYYESGNDTVTCLDDSMLASSSSVAYAYFNSGFSQVIFSAGDPGCTDASLRGRPSVQVMEY